MPTLRNLDKSPRIFWLPADQIFPWAAIAFTSYILFSKVLGLSWIWWGSIAAWGIATWWVLTFKGMYHFFGRLVETPKWTRAIMPYQSVLSAPEVQSKKRRRYR